MHDLLMITNNFKIKEKGDAKLKERFDRMELEYNKLACRRGAIIRKLSHRKTRKTHFLFEDADFSVATIKKLIRQGEVDTF